MVVRPPEPTRSNEPSNFREIQDNIYNLVSFDPGLKRAAAFKPPLKDAVLREEPIEILNRSAFIAENLKDLKRDSAAKAAFLMLDVSDMHFADKAGAGDFVLNRFARTLKETIRHFRLDKDVGLDKAEMKICRYGGDEFSISLVGQYDDELIDGLRKTIEERYKKNDLIGYFKKGLREDDAVIITPIRLKEKEEGKIISVIKRPDDPEEKVVFDQFFKRGHILTPLQIRSAKKMPQLLEFIDKPVEPIYPEAARTIKEKLAYLSKRFPYFAGEIATLSGSKFNDNQREEVLHFLEDRLFDKLFGNIVYSPSEFFERLANYKDIYCFDLKFIREMNDIVSYPEADMTIVNLYQLITNKLAPDLMQFVEIGRRGGTFFVGVKKNGLKTISTRDKIDSALHEIHSLSLTLREKPVTFELGINSGYTDKVFTAKELSDIIEGAEINFYRKIANYLIEKQPDGRTNLEFIFSNRDFNNEKRELNPIDSLIQEFFISKRSLIRANKMLREIMSGEQFKGKIFNELRLVMNKIYEYGFKMKEQGKSIDQEELLGEIEDALQ